MEEVLERERTEKESIIREYQKVHRELLALKDRFAQIIKSI